MVKWLIICIIVPLLWVTCGEKMESPQPEIGKLQLVSIHVGSQRLSFAEPNRNMLVDQPVVVRFSTPIDPNTAKTSLELTKNMIPQEITLKFIDNNKTISILGNGNLSHYSEYKLQIKNTLKGQNQETFPGIEVMFTTLKPVMHIVEVKLDNLPISDFGQRIQNVGFLPNFEISFSHPVSTETLNTHCSFLLGSLNYTYSAEQKADTIIVIKVEDPLPYYRKITLEIDEQLGSDLDMIFQKFRLPFYTKLDSTDKFPRLPDSALLTLVQKQTFSYFWDFGHPVSGLIRERNTSLETVTSGGSGFGLMALIVGMDRGFITREQGISRLHKIVTFLETADRFHGAWSHWFNGTSGRVIPFSANDDGGDIVETSYLAMGLVTIRQYLDEFVPEEKDLINKINLLWESIEWNWYTHGEERLIWHWSPKFGWEKNLTVRGWNEALITYIMAASSPTFPITKEVYTSGWARNGAMLNGQEYYNITLPLGPRMGGPLFFEQYTYLGIDPRKLSDQYANYWEQAKNHTLINRAYCIDNPLNYVGYSSDCWGLTASDGNRGYSAHSPTNDRGVITPTAALASFPFTPAESMKAMHFFYYKMGDRLWGPYGFYDAFNITENWYASSNIAIDQGPILIMIENYRSGLLWELLMSAPEIQGGLEKLGFSY